jgi:hypothetical protein
MGGILAVKRFLLQPPYTGAGLFDDLDSYWFTMLAIGVTLVGFALYVNVSRRSLKDKPKSLAVVLFTMAFTFGVNIIIATYNYYFVFIALAAFILSTLSDENDVFVANFAVSSMTFASLVLNALGKGETGSGFAVMLSIYVLEILIGGLLVKFIKATYHRVSFIILGVIIQSGALGVIFLLDLFLKLGTLFAEQVTLTIICTYAPVFVALLLQPLLENAFSILSNQKLVELTDHSSPLIKRLISEAPGTFNHCLSVASYAEVCAIAIGENPHFARACAYYHDIGKLENPKYFSENQGDENLHDGLLPEVSADILRRHTTDGYALCEKYHIPAEIRDITIQHHGTLPMTVFYYKAKNLTDSDIDIYDYSYHGVTPETKIAATMMICDAAEAAIRAMGKPSPEDVDKLVSGIISDRIERKQFDNCDITMRDLNVIKNTIVDVYGGHVHKRVKYPSGQ